MKSGVFFERDGILNRTHFHRTQPFSPLALDDFEVIDQAIEPLERLKASGFVLLTTTNQPGLSRGSLSRRELEQMHALLKERFPLDDILVCPHDEADRCPCRKPKAGLLTEAAFKWRLDLDHSFVVSERWQDAEAARLVGCTSLLVRSSWNGSGHHDFILDSLSEAAQKILQLSSPATAAYYQGAA
jgi:D-glycero-D-manno-heptose 1,7-bisphosphate phosphatase